MDAATPNRRAGNKREARNAARRRSAAASEARSFFEMVRGGRISRADAWNTIAISPGVKQKLRAAAAEAPSLRTMIASAMSFRRKVLAEFERLLEEQ